jgi:hypothetical protein
VKFLTIAVLVMKGCVLNLQTLTSVVFMNFIRRKIADGTPSHLTTKIKSHEQS